MASTTPDILGFLHIRYVVPEIVQSRQCSMELCVVTELGPVAVGELVMAANTQFLPKLPDRVLSAYLPGCRVQTEYLLSTRVSTVEYVSVHSQSYISPRKPKYPKTFYQTIFFCPNSLIWGVG